jgi:hypothetical protein
MALTVDELPEQFGRASFSGADIEVFAFLAGDTPDVQSTPFHLDSVQVFSLSTFREKVPVRALGHTNVISYVSGPRTFAGTLIMTVIEKHPLYDLIKSGWQGLTIYDNPPNKGHGFSYDERVKQLTLDRRFMPDSLPPINFLLKFSNELGNVASMIVYGVEFTHDGITMSIDDILTENTYQYVARDAVVLVDPGETIHGTPSYEAYRSLDTPGLYSPLLGADYDLSDEEISLATAVDAEGNLSSPDIWIPKAGW